MRQPPKRAPRRHDRDPRTRPKRDDGTRERDEIAARWRAHRDDTGQTLHIVRGTTVIPNHGPTGRTCDRPRAIAAIGPKHEYAPTRNQPGMHLDSTLGRASIVLDQQARARPRRPQLHAGAHLHTLERVTAAHRNRRAYKRRTTSPNDLRSARATHSSAERRCGSRTRAA